MQVRLPAAGTLLWVGLGVLVEIFALPLAIASAGAGHGTYSFAKVLFPFAMIPLALHREILILVAVAGLLQFPTYGFLISRARGGRSKLLVAQSLLITHCAAAIFVWSTV